MAPERPAPRPNALFAFLTQLGGSAGEGLPLAIGMLLGALALLWTGYFYVPASDLGHTDPFITEPSALFVFACLLMILLELAILLDPALKGGWRQSPVGVGVTLGTTVLAIGAVVAARIIGLRNIGDWLANLSVPPYLAFTAANAICLLGLVLGIRFASFDQASATTKGREVIPGERFAGDLVLVALFSAVLASLFVPQLWQLITKLAEVGQPNQPSALRGITACDLSIQPFFRPCTGNDTPALPTMLYIWDVLFIPLICLGGALVTMLFAAYREALRLNQPQAVQRVIGEVLKDIVLRRISGASILLALRFLWPLLIFVAVGLMAVASVAEAQYLYLAANAPGWLIFRFDYDTNSQMIGTHFLGWEFLAALAASLAFLLIVSATALHVVPRKREGQSLRPEVAFGSRHVRFFADTLGYSYWIISLIFSIINGVILSGEWVYNALTARDVVYWTPFIQPDVLAIVSLLLWFFYRRPRGRRLRPAMAPAAK
jgi:hypothetical protein